MTLVQLKGLFVAGGCKTLYAKPLSANDNSKNQVYFGPGFEALNVVCTPDHRKLCRELPVCLPAFGFPKNDARQLPVNAVRRSKEFSNQTSPFPFATL